MVGRTENTKKWLLLFPASNVIPQTKSPVHGIQVTKLWFIYLLDFSLLTCKTGKEHNEKKLKITFVGASSRHGDFLSTLQKIPISKCLALK